MKKTIFTTLLLACAATASAASITSFTFTDTNGCYSAPGSLPCGGIIGVTLPGSTANAFISTINLANGTYNLFFGPEQYFEGFSGRLTIGFSDSTSTFVDVPALSLSAYSLSQSIVTTGDPSIRLAIIGNTGVDRVGSGTLTSNNVDDAILSFSNVAAPTGAPEPATAGMMLGAFGLLGFIMFKRRPALR